MTKTRTALAAVAAIALAGTVLAACSSSEESTSASASAVPSASVAASALASLEPSASASMVGTSPGTWSPVEISMNDNGKKIKLVVGQAAVFTDLPANDATNTIIVRSKPKGIVKVSQQGESDGASMNAGLVGLQPGKATVTVYDGKPKAKGTVVVMVIKVKVKPAP